MKRRPTGWQHQVLKLSSEYWGQSCWAEIVTDELAVLFEKHNVLLKVKISGCFAYYQLDGSLNGLEGGCSSNLTKIYTEDIGPWHHVPVNNTRNIDPPAERRGKGSFLGTCSHVGRYAWGGHTTYCLNWDIGRNRINWDYSRQTGTLVIRDEITALEWNLWQPLLSTTRKCQREGNVWVLRPSTKNLRMGQIDTEVTEQSLRGWFSKS